MDEGEEGKLSAHLISDDEKWSKMHEGSMYVSL